MLVPIPVTLKIWDMGSACWITNVKNKNEDFSNTLNDIKTNLKIMKIYFKNGQFL